MICDRCVNFKGDARFYNQYNLWLCGECKRWLDEMYELINEVKDGRVYNALYSK